MIVFAWFGCAEPIDADAALRWARRHETTLLTVETQLDRALGQFPSFPGDVFACREITVPPGIPDDQREPLIASLCRQREALWNADRHDAENELGTAWLNSTMQSFGAVGVELVVAGPDGTVEWSDHRGTWQLSGDGAVPAESGVELGPARLGWGEVEVTLASANPVAAAAARRPTLEWRREKPWHQAKITARLLLLADGTPDAAFVRKATGFDGPTE